MSSIESWTNELWKVLLNYEGTREIVNEAQTRWEKFKDKPNLRVVIFGAYDAGKSTLLKRLLVEDETEVPDWVTISGRRETFEVQKVHSNGIEYVDTPGLSSGTDEHDERSIKALSLSDAYLWVLPPQLITTDKAEYINLLEQDSIKVPSILESTVVAIARMDEAGTDPNDNLKGYRELVQNKKQEFTNLISNSGLDIKPLALHGVAADPYQMVGNDTDVTIQHYKMGKEWDGINELKNSLSSLSKKKKELRRYAGARFVANLALEVKSKLSEQISEYKLILEGLESEVEHHIIYKKELDALKKRLEAELHRDIEDELLSLSRSTTKISVESLKKLESSLIDIVDEWSKNSNAEIKKLVEEFELDINSRVDKPSFKGLRDLIDKAERDARKHEGKDGFSEIGKKVFAFGPAVREAFNKYAHSELGTTLKNAADIIEKSKTSSEALKDYVKNTPLKTLDNLDKASKYVKWDRAMTAIGPIVEQMGGLVLDVVDDHMSRKKAEKRAEKRKELREDLREEAQNIEDEASQNLEIVYKGISDWINERIDSLKDSQSEMEKFLDNLRQFLNRINTKL